MVHPRKFIRDAISEPVNRKISADGVLFDLYTQGGHLGSILDIGAGKTQYHAKFLKAMGGKVTTIDFNHKVDISADYLEYDFGNTKFDTIWCSHVLEHQLNPHHFLIKIFNDLKDGGKLAITVPPLKTELVGGHINLFTPAMLVYRLILAGFDCSKARVSEYGYNISVLVDKKQANLPKDLTFDHGDIEKLAHFFPGLVYQGFEGSL